MSKFLFTVFVLLVLAMGIRAQADVYVENRTLIIDASAHRSGRDAGNVQVHLSYINAEKTEISVSGGIQFRHRGQEISQRINIRDIDSIQILAIGQKGMDGEPGEEGRRGFNGRAGKPGCPPERGERGGNGEYGSAGGPGQDGGDGGDIRISADADQTELLLLVSAKSRGGEGGRGGDGGAGGRGGEGGAGGENTCTNKKGERINGPAGQRGEDGASGGRGSNGYSGRDGRKGSVSFDVVSSQGTQSFKSPFDLEVNSVVTVDDNEDGIIEPGEKLHLMSLRIANHGSMPTPMGQSIQLILQNSATLTVEKSGALAFNEVVPAGAVREIKFQKGEVVLNVPKSKSVLGESTTVVSRMAINNIGWKSSVSTGRNIQWRMGVSTKHEDMNTYFAIPKLYGFTVRNISSKAVGEDAAPFEVRIEWVSKDIPGSDVGFTMSNGQSYSLSQPVVIKDLKVPAHSEMDVPMNFMVANSKNAVLGKGELKISIALKHERASDFEVIDAMKSSTRYVLDIRPLDIHRSFKVSGMSCNFPGSFTGSSEIASVEIAKNKGEDSMRIRFSTRGVFEDDMSKIYKMTAFDFSPFSRKITNKPTRADLIEFFNEVMPEVTRRGEGNWRVGRCGSAE